MQAHEERMGQCCFGQPIGGSPDLLEAVCRDHSQGPEKPDAPFEADIALRSVAASGLDGTEVVRVCSSKEMPAVANKLQVTPAECKRRAAECRKMAENAPSPHVRDTLADIERMWNRLAVETEVSQAMVSRFLGGAAFGPDEIAIMTGAYEAGLKQINVSGHNDVAAEALAQTIVSLAKHGERDPVRLRQRAVEIMSGSPGQANVS